MLAKVLSSAVLGIDGYIVEVEVDIAGGLPSFSTVGLPEGAVRESKDRVKAAIKNAGYDFPSRTHHGQPGACRYQKGRLGLRPSDGHGDPRGEGDHRSGQSLTYLILGELSLDGKVKPVKGALPMSVAAREPE